MNKYEVRVRVARALRHDAAVTIFDLTLRLENELSMALVGEALTWLEAQGYVKRDVESSTVGPSYHLAHQGAVSDLCGRLGWIRDPVREGHEHEATRGTQARLHRSTQEGADLDRES